MPRSEASGPSLSTPPVSQSLVSRPLPPVPPKPQLPSVSTPTIPATQNQDKTSVKSFIRTMESDIKSLKQGAEPKGVEVTIPKSSSLPSLSQPQTGVPVPAKPAVPTPTIRIGEAEKREVLPGIKPPTSVAPPKTEQPKTIVVPPKKAGFLSKSLIITVAVVVLAAGGAYWFFVLKQKPEPVATVTFTPRPTPIPDPLKPLKNLFPLSNPANIPNSVSLTDLSSVRSAISATVTDSQIKNIFITPKDELGKSISFSEFAKRFLVNQSDPSSKTTVLLNSVYDNNFGLVYSLQEEKFDSKGKPVLNAPTERRLALLVEVSDLPTSQSTLSSWESNLALDIKGLFELGGKVDKQVFQDNAYRDTPIRFANFPNPDRSIDYAFIKSANGKQYLAVASSRAQIYLIIDTLLGF